MAPAAAAIGEAVLSAVLSDKVIFHRRHVTDMALAALSVLLAGVGVFYTVASIDRYLSGSAATAVGALAAAGASFAFCALAAFLAAHLHKKKKASFASARREIGRNIHGLVEDLCREMDGPVRDNPKTAVLLAALTGFFAASGWTAHR